MYTLSQIQSAIVKREDIKSAIRKAEIVTVLVTLGDGVSLRAKISKAEACSIVNQIEEGIEIEALLLDGELMLGR